MKQNLAFLFFLCFFCTKIQSQSVKSPEQFLPHKIGEQFSAHYQVVSYFDYVAANSPNVKLIRYGATNEERPLLLAFISTKENLDNLEKIRTNHLKKAKLIDGAPENQQNPIAIVWLSHTVHGNEPSGTESSMLTLYKLCTDEASKKWLKNTIVIIDPTLNPDGYDRYTSWFRGVSHNIPNGALESREHIEPWPGGRVNHYYFDLNRDWAWQTQTETQARIKQYQQWMPHVHADLHEQYYNNPYYFAPAAQPFHKSITPWQSAFQTEIGNNHAKYFDEKGWLYFTKEVFDLFYPSYGDTYPMFNGSIGMTYEQAGHNRGGRATNLENGDVLTLENRALHHHTTAISTVEISSQNADKLDKNFSEYFENAVTNPQGIYKTFIIKGTNIPAKIKDFCAILDKNNIRYGAVKGGTANGLNYTTGKTESYTLSNEDLIISTSQPMSVLTSVLFEPESVLSDSLTYDITAWSLLYAFGLDAIATKEKIVPNAVFKAKILDTSAYSDKSGSPYYAYIATWDSPNNAEFLAELHQKNIRVRCADEAFEIQNKKFAAGTLLILRADNRSIESALDKMLKDAADKFGQPIFRTNTGMVTKGHDFGSDKLRLLRKPNVAMFWNDNVSETAFGHVWYHFEKKLNYPLSVLNTSQINLSTLKNYNFLIMPDGSYGLDSATLDKLKIWMSEGGTILAMDNALTAFEDKSGFALAKYSSKKDKEEADAARDKLAEINKLQAYDRSERAAITDFNPGIILKLRLDKTHPLAYGLGENYFSLKTNTLSYPYLKDAINVGTTDENLTTYGFVGARMKEKLKKNSTIAVQNIGSGKIIFLADSPLFRGFWYQGKLLFANALFLTK